MAIYSCDADHSLANSGFNRSTRYSNRLQCGGCGQTGKITRPLHLRNFALRRRVEGLLNPLSYDPASSEQAQTLSLLTAIQSRPFLQPLRRGGRFVCELGQVHASLAALACAGPESCCRCRVLVCAHTEHPCPASDCHRNSEAVQTPDRMVARCAVRDVRPVGHLCCPRRGEWVHGMSGYRLRSMPNWPTNLSLHNLIQTNGPEADKVIW